MIKGRGDRPVRRWVRVFGEGGAFGSRMRERPSAVRRGKVSVWEAALSLRVVLCTGEGTVESAEPAESAQSDRVDWLQKLL